MGETIFFGALVAEAFLVLYSFTTRSYQLRLRSTIRAIMLALILWVIGSRVIQWAFSTYSLITGLVILLLLASAILLHLKERRRKFKKTAILLNGIGMTLIIFVLILPTILFPGYQGIEPSGEYRVTSTVQTYTDNQRLETFSDSGEYRKLTVGMWYPENARGKYPLVVFSPGGISTRVSNESLYHELASHGYIVCAIDHTYHSLFTTSADRRTILIDSGYMQELNRENAQSNPEQSFELYQKWMTLRMDDIGFVIDHIHSQTYAVDSAPFYALVDPAQVSVIGHSAGGAAALGMARVRHDIGAVIALEAPFLWDIQGVENSGFVFTEETYPVPLLHIYSDSSWNYLAEWPQYEQNDRLLSDQAATVFNVHISGAGHFSLTDLALSSPRLTRWLNGFEATNPARSTLMTINELIVDFLDDYLKGETVFIPIESSLER